MTWFKVDDRWHSHRKVIGVSLSARGLWATLGSWCAAELNGGHVPHDVVRHYASTKKLSNKLSKELVDAGLWESVDGGFNFHDWHDHQPTKEVVLARRTAVKARVTRHRNAVTTPLPPRYEDDCNGVGNADPDPDPDPDQRKKTRAREPQPHPDSAPEAARSSSIPCDVAPGCPEPANGLGKYGSDRLGQPGLRQSRWRERPPPPESTPPEFDEPSELSDYALARKLYAEALTEKGVVWMQHAAVWAHDAFVAIAEFSVGQSEIDGFTTGQVIAAVIESYFSDPKQAEYTWNLRYLGEHISQIYLKHPAVAAQRAQRGKTKLQVVS
jgi:hypothetical protein